MKDATANNKNQNGSTVTASGKNATQMKTNNLPNFRSQNIATAHQISAFVNAELSQCENLLQVCNVLNRAGYSAVIMDGEKPSTATAASNHVIGSVFGRPVVKVCRNSTPPRTLLPIDSVPVFTPTWDEIKGKAHLYATARLRSTGEYVQLCRVVKYIDGGELTEPVFACRIPSMAGVEHRTTEELCAFCL